MFNIFILEKFSENQLIWMFFLIAMQFVIDIRKLFWLITLLTEHLILLSICHCF